MCVCLCQTYRDRTFLVTYDVSRKIVHFKAGDQLLSCILKAFGLHREGDDRGFIIQEWNDEWKEYIYMEGEMPKGCKLQLTCMKRMQVLPNQEMPGCDPCSGSSGNLPSPGALENGEALSVTDKAGSVLVASHSAGSCSARHSQAATLVQEHGEASSGANSADNLPNSSNSAGPYVARHSQASTSSSTTAATAIAYKKWASPYKIPVHRFSFSLRNQLQKKAQLNWALRKELKDILVDDLLSFTAYPSKAQRDEVCSAVLSQFPHLREPIGSGFDGLSQSMKDRLKSARRDMADDVLEIKEVKRRKPMNCPTTLKKPKKGEINWQPNYPEGEDEASVDRHIEFMLKESKKSPHCQDSVVVSSKMDITFAARRQMINAKCPIPQLRDRYPLLFSKNQITAEYRRLMNMEIEEGFTENMLKVSPKLVAVARNRKVIKKDMMAILEGLSQAKATGGEAGYHDAVAAIQLLPLLLGEDGKMFIRVLEVNKVHCTVSLASGI